MWICFLVLRIRAISLGYSCKLGSSCKWRSIDIWQSREGERRGSKFLPSSSRQQRHWRSVAEAERASGAPPNQKESAIWAALRSWQQGMPWSSREKLRGRFIHLYKVKGKNEGDKDRAIGSELEGWKVSKKIKKQKKTLRSAFYTECRRDQIFEVLAGLL